MVSIYVSQRGVVLKIKQTLAHICIDMLIFVCFCLVVYKIMLFLRLRKYLRKQCVSKSENICVRSRHDNSLINLKVKKKGNMNYFRTHHCVQSLLCVRTHGWFKNPPSISIGSYEFSPPYFLGYEYSMDSQSISNQYRLTFLNEEQESPN